MVLEHPVSLSPCPAWDFATLLASGLPPRTISRRHNADFFTFCRYLVVDDTPSSTALFVRGSIL